jgi:molybdopterin molybdotransferase
MTESAEFPMHLGVDEARARIVEICTGRALGSEPVPLAAALGRIVAHDVAAPFDVPGHANSAMDGFALRAADLPAAGETALRLVGAILAGGSAAPEVSAGTCVRITTGAVLPAGADTVVMKENTRSDGGTVWIAAGTAPGANVRPAGEDYRAGDAAIARGTKLSPAHLGVLASFGVARVDVSRRPRAVLLTTGDELVAPGHPLGFGQIHDSNAFSLGALLRQHGVDIVRHERVRDDPALLRDALERAGRDADLAVSSGGVSAGEADYLPALVREIGRVHLWKVRIRPGMPFLFGEVGGALLFALPGNPVSGIAILLTLLRPGLDALTGATAPQRRLYARLLLPVHKRHARAEFQRATLLCDLHGTLTVRPQSRQGSGMLRGVAEADALIVLPEGEREFAVGDVVEVVPLPGWPVA